MLIKQLKMQQILFLVLTISLVASPAISAFVDDVRVDLTHVDAGKRFAKLELIQRPMQRSKARAATLSVDRNSGCYSGITRAGLPVHPSGGYEYVLELAIGTPPRPISALLDTGSDLIWTQCSPCAKCIPQPDPLFIPAMSSSYKPVPCSSKLCTEPEVHNCHKHMCTYDYSYGDMTRSRGVYATESFTFASFRKKIRLSLRFGCGVVNAENLNNGSGIFGFGRGPISLVSQFAIPRFSYCFTPFTGTKKSTLLFGSLANLYSNITGPVQTTVLLTNPQLPTLNYVEFTGITVGAERLPIPESAFTLKADGSGWVYIDSGTTITEFPPVAFGDLKKAFATQLKLPAANDSSQVGLALGLELCFAVPAGNRPSRVQVPRLVFHFKGADLDLPRSNYILDDHKKGLVCVILAESSDGRSAIGNIVQQDMRVLYDLEKESLSFAPARC